MKDEFERLARMATRCRECFIGGDVTAPYIDVAQPRWVGHAYWESPFRVVVLMINPGRSPKKSTSATDYLPRVRAFRDGQTTLDELLEMQPKRIESSWVKFRQFYVAGLALKLDEIAFANVAWCATAENHYPRRMLERCFARHTGPLLKLLRPDVVVASGRPVRPYARRGRELWPNAKVIEMLHYAHRKGRAEAETELARVRAELAAARAAGRAA
jgi:hypothetical protein